MTVGPGERGRRTNWSASINTTPLGGRDVEMPDISLITIQVVIHWAVGGTKERNQVRQTKPENISISVKGTATFSWA